MDGAKNAKRADAANVSPQNAITNQPTASDKRAASVTQGPWPRRRKRGRPFKLNCYDWVWWTDPEMCGFENYTPEPGKVVDFRMCNAGQRRYARVLFYDYFEKAWFGQWVDYRDIVSIMGDRS